MITVKAVEAVIGAYPEKTLLVLKDGIDRILRKPQVIGNAFQPQLLPVEQRTA